MSNVVVMRLMDGSTILTDAKFVHDADAWWCEFPMIIETIRIKGGEATTAFPYMPGCKESMVTLKSNVVIATLPACNFYKNLLGSAILKYVIQDIVRETKGVLTDYHKLQIQSTKIDIESKYGLIELDDDEDNLNKNKTSSKMVMH